MAAGKSTQVQLWVPGSCATVDNGSSSLHPIPAGACQLSPWLQPSAVHLESGGHTLGWLSFSLLVGSEAGRAS